MNGFDVIEGGPLEPPPVTGGKKSLVWKGLKEHLCRAQAYATVDAWRFPWVIFRVCSNNTSLLFGAKGYLALCEQLSDMLLSTLEIGTTQLRSVTEIAPKSPVLMCEQKFYPVWFTCRRKSYPYLPLCYFHLIFLNFILCTKFRKLIGW